MFLGIVTSFHITTLKIDICIDALRRFGSDNEANRLCIRMFRLCNNHLQNTNLRLFAKFVHFYKIFDKNTQAKPHNL